MKETYKDNCIKYSEGRYIAKLPWKPDHAPLPTNFDITKKRTESTTKRLSKEPQLFDKYGEIIKEQENRGFVEQVDDDSQAKRLHHIPHHGVKKDSATTSIRTVYDCSCRNSSGSPSFNDCLKSTPPDLNDLTVILMRFRLGAYAVLTAIETAFLHVYLHEDDRDVIRVFWLSDPSDPYINFTTDRFRVVLFGVMCSPIILIS